MVSFRNFITLALALAPPAMVLHSEASLAGLPREELNTTASTVDFHPENPPGPMKFNGTKLVNDDKHPWMPLRKGDIRGPCPGLNTLASHGYLPRNGIATPAQIVNAVQEGFNMKNSVAILLAYGGLLVDGNVITNKMSIGGKTPLTGPDPPAPAIVGGLNTHAVFEGDASMTRGDAFFGDNHSFNETLFDEFIAFSNKFGAGKYNLTVAGELRFQRIQESIATNPNFSFTGVRYFGAYGETVFPLNFFIDGRKEDGQLDLDVARGFFQGMRMPKDFHRASEPSGGGGIEMVVAAHPIQPGTNVGGVNNFVPDPTSGNFSNRCGFYENLINQTLLSLYPKPTGVLRKALNFNLNVLHAEGFGFSACPQIFPYGKGD